MRIRKSGEGSRSSHHARVGTGVLMEAGSRAGAGAGHTRQGIGRSRSRRRIGERHRRRRADRHTRHRRRQLQGEGRNRGAAAREGVPERDVRGNGSPCDGRRTGTARNRSRRKNRAGTSTIQLSRKKLNRAKPSHTPASVADQGGSQARLRRQRARSDRGLNSLRADEQLAQAHRKRRDPRKNDTCGGLLPASSTQTRTDGSTPRERGKTTLPRGGTARRTRPGDAIRKYAGAGGNKRVAY